MTNYPFMSNTENLKEFIVTISTRNVPAKVNQPYLEKIGYKSKSDRTIIKVLKFIEFIDGKNIPTENFTAYLDTTKQRTIMSKCIEAGYSALFALYSDAYARDNEALTNFFRPESKLGEEDVNSILLTFRTLCELADFDSSGTISVTHQQPGETPSEKSTIVKQIHTPTLGIPIHLNIQLHLPKTEDTAIYDAIFKSMRKYLLESEKKDD